MTKIVTSCISILILSIPTYGQILGGGSPGGGSPGGGSPGGGSPGGGSPGGITHPNFPGWRIELRGFVLSPSGYFWRKQSFTETTPGDVGTTPGAAGPNYSGTVEVRLKWYGVGTPTVFPNYTIRSSSAIQGGGPANGTVNNGFEEKTGSLSIATTKNYKLIQPGKKLEHTTMINVSATSGFPNFFTTYFVFQAAIDPRYARIKSDSIPDQPYYEKGESYMAEPIVPSKILWKRTVQLPAIPVPKIAPALKDPVQVIGASAIDIRKIGLPTGIYNAFEAVKSNVLKTWFFAEVLQEHIAGESYTFSETEFSTTVSETLPSFGGGWDIEPIGMLPFKGANIKLFHPFGKDDQINYSENVRLIYNWTDGLQADSLFQITFLEEHCNALYLGQADVVKNETIDYIFKEVPGYSSGWEYRPKGPQPVVYGKDPFIKHWGSAAVSLGSQWATGVWGKLLSLLGFGFSLYDSSNEEGTLSCIDNPWQQDPTGYVDVRFDFTSPQVEAIYLATNESDRYAVYGESFMWKAQYRKTVPTVWTRYDHYLANGYMGNVVQRDEKKSFHKPEAEPVKKYWILIGLEPELPPVN